MNNPEAHFMNPMMQSSAASQPSKKQRGGRTPGRSDRDRHGRGRPPQPSTTTSATTSTTTTADDAIARRRAELRRLTQEREKRQQEQQSQSSSNGHAKHDGPPPSLPPAVSLERVRYSDLFPSVAKSPKTSTSTTTTKINMASMPSPPLSTATTTTAAPPPPPPVNRQLGTEFSRAKSAPPARPPPPPPPLPTTLEAPDRIGSSSRRHHSRSRSRSKKDGKSKKSSSSSSKTKSTTRPAPVSVAALLSTGKQEEQPGPPPPPVLVEEELMNMETETEPAPVQSPKSSPNDEGKKHQSRRDRLHQFAQAANSPERTTTTTTTATTTTSLEEEEEKKDVVPKEEETETPPPPQPLTTEEQPPVATTTAAMTVTTTSIMEPQPHYEDQDSQQQEQDDVPMATSMMTTTTTLTDTTMHSESSARLEAAYKKLQEEKRQALKQIQQLEEQLLLKSSNNNDNNNSSSPSKGQHHQNPQPLQQLLQMADHKGQEAALKWARDLVSGVPNLSITTTSGMSMGMGMGMGISSAPPSLGTPMRGLAGGSVDHPSNHRNFVRVSKPVADDNTDNHVGDESSDELERQYISFFRQAAECIPYQYQYHHHQHQQQSSERQTVMATFCIRRPYGIETQPELFQFVSPTPSTAYARRAHCDPATLEVAVTIHADDSYMLLFDKAGVRYHIRKDQQDDNEDGQENNNNNNNNKVIVVPNIHLQDSSFLGTVPYVDADAKDQDYSLDELFEQALLVREQYCSTLTSTAFGFRDRPPQEIVKETQIEVVKEVFVENKTSSFPDETIKPAMVDMGVDTSDIPYPPKQIEVVHKKENNETKTTTTSDTPSKKKLQDEEDNDAGSSSGDVLAIFLGMIFSNLWGLLYWILIGFPLNAIRYSLTLLGAFGLLGILYLYHTNNDQNNATMLWHDSNLPGVL